MIPIVIGTKNGLKSNGKKTGRIENQRKNEDPIDPKTVKVSLNIAVIEFTEKQECIHRE